MPTMQAVLALAVLSPAESPRSLPQPGEPDGFTLQGLMLKEVRKLLPSTQSQIQTTGLDVRVTYICGTVFIFCFLLLWTDLPIHIFCIRK